MSRNWRLLLLALRFVLGAMFVWAGAVKAPHPFDFSEDVGNYQIFSGAAALVAAFYLPWLEVVCGPTSGVIQTPQYYALIAEMMREYKARRIAP